ncbi:MAG: hypothetical protein KDC61_12815 [Saprospiraceae bacterium]|nr:hypothetical protein [Saprospiraceae bacterium]MCB0542667.1 hypothetical protein [Saprospiraceae bacterium]MCB0575434.1 hypothetical protein [Saprospiraceae bacterium]MCB9352999.1 hypothetical protein [Lewinellaceae bacterium]
MKNKVMALSAAVLLSAGIAFAFVKPNTTACAASSSCSAATEACCVPCPIEDCPLPCCPADASCGK